MAATLPPELDGLCLTAVVFLLFYFIFLLIFVHLFFACPLFVCLLVSYHQNSIKNKQKNNSISDLQNYFVFLVVSVHLFFCLSLFWFYLFTIIRIQSKTKNKKKTSISDLFLFFVCPLFVSLLVLSYQNSVKNKKTKPKKK